jgi:hypothetical protein
MYEGEKNAKGKVLMVLYICREGASHKLYSTLASGGSVITYGNVENSPSPPPTDCLYPTSSHVEKIE